MRRRLFTFLAAMMLSSGLSGCAHRLSGPDYPADAPPWISMGSTDPAGASSGQNTFDLDIRHRVVMIGDAGYYLENDATLIALDEWATAVGSSSVVFLGDNIYNEGLTDDDREHGERILAQQLNATEVPKIFIPGNHDWGLLPRDQNARAIRNQQAYVDEWPAGRSEFIPKEGCMGPTKRVLMERTDRHKAVVFIALDPTPWINERLREDCPTELTQDAFLAELDAELEAHREDFVIVASHYPMLTGGPHGGLSYGFFADLIITPLGWMMGGLANTYEPEYADWIARTQTILRRNPPALYAAGHDHSLQLLHAGDVAGLYVVSGAGALERVSTVTHLPESYFAHAAPGFIVADFGDQHGESTIVLRVIEAQSKTPVFEMKVP